MLPARAQSRLLRRRPALGAMGVCTAPTASWLPTLIYPQTAKDAQARLLASLKGTDAAAKACAGIDPATLAAWEAFYAAASAFAAQDPGVWGLGSRMDQTQAYGYALCQWQEKIASANCAGVPPDYGSEQQTPPGPPAATWIHALEILAGLALIGGVLYVSAPAVRELASEFASSRRRRVAA